MGSIVLKLQTRLLPAGELVDFPLFLSLEHALLRHFRHGGGVRRSDGRDIGFRVGRSKVPLPREIRSYDPLRGILEAWVRLPRFSRRSPSRLVCFCGAPESTRARGTVWDDAYRLVVHDPASPSDATGRNRLVAPSRGAAVRVVASPTLRFADSITVEAWIDDPDARGEALQALVSRWSPSRSFRAFSAYDAGDTDRLDARGYLGAAFDGRCVYFAPQANATLRENGTRRHGIVLRCDTRREFRSRAAWSAYDAGRTDGLETRGYYGGVFDGRYVYFTPRFDGSSYHSRVLRYDTLGSFRSPQSWAAHDAGLDISYQSAGFDGRFIYFVPGHQPDPTRLRRERSRYNTATSQGGSGRVLRLDTKAPFKDPASWAVYDAAGTNGLPTVYFDGAVFDGRFLHFVPLYYGAPLRYDTLGGFSDPASWTAFDASSMGMDMCVGGVFDGTYLYFVPYRGDAVIRYDTRRPHEARRSWSRFRLRGVRGLSRRGWDGAVFDGKYVYFIPYWSGTENAHRVPQYFHGTMLRYDAARSFHDPASWSVADASHTDGLDTRGYNGAAFDGRYLYCAAWEKGEGETTNIKGHGCFLRYDTVGPGGGFTLRSCDLGHNGGLIAALPGPRFMVNTDRGVASASADRALAPGRHYLVGVYDGRRIRLYLDGHLVKSRTAPGRLVRCEEDLAIDGILDGLGRCRGKITGVRVSACARSAAYVRAQHLCVTGPGRLLSPE